MSLLLVGDDVVDLGRERTRAKASDRRFLERVLAPGEIRLVEESPAPDLELWTLWACKEAAYKVHSKALGEPPTFVHADYRVERPLPETSRGGASAAGGTVLPAGAAGEGEATTARVRWDGGAVAVDIGRSAAVVHAVAWDRSDQETREPPRLPTTHRLEAQLGELDDAEALWAGPLSRLLERFTRAEADAIHSRASAAVRLAARHSLARLLAVEERRLEIVCAPGVTGRRPPAVRLDGAPCEADVSFTHDGRWIAWAASVPRRHRARRTRVGS